MSRRALHYLRDDSVLRRHRHLIGIARGAALDEAWITDRDRPCQAVADRMTSALYEVCAALSA